MKNPKNILIAILTGLLVLTLSTQNSHSAPKTYDAVQLAEYSACLINFHNSGQGHSKASMSTAGWNCNEWRPR